MKNYLPKTTQCRILLTLLAGVTAAILAACQDDNAAAANTPVTPVAEPAQRINFGVYTADKATKVVEQFAPILRDLEESVSKKIGRPVKIQINVSSDYATGISALAKGEVHFSRLGPASYITASEENPNLQLLAMESKKGARTFNGIIAVHEDCEIEKLEDLKGQSFAFGSRLSTIGCFLSQAELMAAGLRGTDFEKFDFLERHDTVGMAVIAREYTAGALKESTFKELAEQGHPIKVLKKFENVTKPWVAHSSLDREVFDALRDSLLEMKGSSISKDGFLSALDSHYDPVRVAMKLAQNF